MRIAGMVERLDTVLVARFAWMGDGHANTDGQGGFDSRPGIAEVRCQN